GEGAIIRAIRVLQRVIEPYNTRTTHADTGGMYAGGVGLGIDEFFHASISSWLCLSDYQPPNRASEAFGPPDIAYAIGSDQMGSQTRASGSGVAYLKLFKHATADFSDFSNRVHILSEPDIIAAINRNAVGLAVGRSGFKLLNSASRGIEFANFIRIVFSEP